MNRLGLQSLCLFVLLLCNPCASWAHALRLPIALRPDQVELVLFPISLSDDQLEAIRPGLFELSERVHARCASAAEVLGPIQARARKAGLERNWTDEERRSFERGFPVRRRAIRDVVRIYQSWIEEELAPLLSPGQLLHLEFVQRRIERVVYWQSAYLARHQSLIDPVWFMLDSLRVAHLDDPAVTGAVLALLRQADVEVSRSLRDLFYDEERDRERVFTSLNITRFSEFTESEFLMWREHARVRLAREKQFARLGSETVDRATSFLDAIVRDRIRFDWMRVSHPVLAEPLLDTADAKELGELQKLMTGGDEPLALLVSDVIDTWLETDLTLLQRIARRHERFLDEMAGGDPGSREDFRDRFRDVWALRIERAREYGDVLRRLGELAQEPASGGESASRESFGRAVLEHLERHRKRLAELEVAGDIANYDPDAWPNRTR